MMIKYKRNKDILGKKTVRMESVVPSDPVSLSPLPLLPVLSCPVLKK